MTMIRMVGLAACLAATPIFALEQGEYRFNGFGTVGFNHLGGEEEGTGFGVEGQTKTSWRGDELSKLGGQSSYGITDDLSATLQVLARAKHDSWEVMPEWAYLAYQANDNLTLRAGRMGTNFYMYSETLNVGFTYPWLSLPTEVYGQVQLTNAEGVDLIYSHTTPYGQLVFQAAAGQAKNRDLYLYDTMQDFDYEDRMSASLQLATNRFGDFRIGYSEANVTLEASEPVTVFTGTGFGPGTVDVSSDGLKGKYTSIGHRFDNGTYLTSSEITKLVIENDGSKEALAYYVMGGRRFGDYLGHLTFAERKSGGLSQDSWTVGMNYSLLPNATLKGEYKRVSADAGYGSFDNSFQDIYDAGLHQATGGALGQPLEKRDADIVSVGIDFVF
ncbi:hypothetical protein [Halopseudomonas salegens]|uniref:Porin n=1 Tax=Halopseudomonas salegens TaxID=1434072 RepID=A0A1H2E590_9GAMM|nr:hypothetical protein [Halopseudomonas salegens]SDT90281.1 hypothetical protein SAMN05216210_0348 [Halopseudomonas salegens]